MNTTANPKTRCQSTVALVSEECARTYASPTKRAYAREANKESDSMTGQSPTILAALEALEEYKRLIAPLTVPRGHSGPKSEAQKEELARAFDAVARHVWKQRRQKRPQSTSERLDMKAVKAFWRDMSWQGYPTDYTLKLLKRRDFFLYCEIEALTRGVHRTVRREEPLFEDPREKKKRLAAEAKEITQ